MISNLIENEQYICMISLLLILLRLFFLWPTIWFVMEYVQCELEKSMHSILHLPNEVFYKCWLDLIVL